MGLVVLGIVVPLVLGVCAGIYLAKDVKSTAGAIATFIGVFIFAAAAGLLLSFGACVAIIGFTSS